MNRSFRVTAYGMAALFLVGAVVQWNDPDPWAWIGAYAAGAGLSSAAARGVRLPSAHLAVAVLYGLWFATIASSLIGAPQEAFTSFEMQATSHEEPREAVGLALLCGWNALLAWRTRGE